MQERGSALVEYSIGVMILLGILVIAGQIMLTATGKRVSAAEVIEFNYVPCGTSLGLLSDDECK